MLHGGMPKPAVVTHFDRRFAALGTRARAVASKAYMKSDLAFHGITAKHLRDEAKTYCIARPPTHATLKADVDALFATDNFDLRWAGIALLERNPQLLTTADLPWLIELARIGACWAFVDYLASRAFEPILERERSIATYVRRWAKDDNFWIRRIALLSQLRALRHGGGDFALFASIAAPMIPETEFFIRKAIGWVLREVSKQRPALVRDFLLSHPDCSGVTWREAVKYLPAPMRRTVDQARQ